MKQYIALSLVITLLSGCMTARLYEKQLKTNTKNVITTDTVRRLVLPTKLIDGYDKAVIVAVGDTHDYLLTTAKNYPDIYRDWLKQIDFRYMTIDNNFNQSHQEWFEVGHINSQFNKSLSEVSWRYVKPSHFPISDNERAILTKLNFNCYSHDYNNKTGQYDIVRPLDFCYQTMWTDITIVQKAQNSGQHLTEFNLQKPIEFVFYTEKMVTPAKLMPLAVIFDVVTFPAQVLIAPTGALDKK